MKKILIISQGDMTAAKLLELYHTMYGHVSKELIMCSIDLSECRNEGMTMIRKKASPKLIKQAPNPLKNYFVQSKPKKTVQAKNCKEIIDIIKDEHIGVVIIPNYLYDSDKAFQLISIVKDIKRHSRAEVIGVYI